MADLPIWRAIAAVRVVQDGIAPAGAGQEIASALREHAEAMRVEVERALAIAPDDDVRARLEHALETLTSVAAQVESTGDLEEVLGQNFSGAAIRTRENPFSLFTANESAIENAEPSALEVSESIDPSVAALAASLGNDPWRIYEHVATAIEPAIYAGHFRAPHEVLEDGIGNDADLAGLLVALLRAAGTEARLVYGAIRISEEVAAAWLDVRDPATQQQLLRDAGFTVFAMPGTLDIFEHFRVRARIGAEWVDLDPSLRAFEILAEGDRAWTRLPWVPAGAREESTELDYLFDDDATDGPLAWYEAKLGERTARLRRRVSVDALPYMSTGFAAEQNWFTPAQQHAIRLHLVGPGGTMLEHRFALPGHCRERVTIRWVPATATAEALLASADGPLAAPAFALDLRPQLHIGGEVIEGTGFASAGTPLFCALALQHPNALVARSSEARPLCGTAWEIVIEPPGAHVRPAPLTSRFEPLGPGSFVDQVRPLLVAYHRRLVHAAARVAALTDGVAVSAALVTMGALSNETIAIGGVAMRRRPSAVLIDVKNIELRLYDRDGQALAPFVELFACEGSYHESRVMLDHLALSSMSAVTALRAALRDDDSLRAFTPETRSGIDELEHPTKVRRAMSLAIGISGRTEIITTRRPVEFGMRLLSAWIARGGNAQSSDYAIASISGG